MSELARPLLGWPLFALPDDEGRLGWPTLERSVRESIQVILSTRPGEQLMRPDFGGGLEALLHEPNTLETRRRVRDLVMATLQRWERRIVLDRVEVSEVVGEPSTLRVDIGWRVVLTGSAGALAMTMQFKG